MNFPKGLDVFEKSVLSVIQTIESTTEIEKIKPIDIIFCGSIINKIIPVKHTILNGEDLIPIILDMTQTQSII